MPAECWDLHPHLKVEFKKKKEELAKKGRQAMDVGAVEESIGGLEEEMLCMLCNDQDPEVLEELIGAIGDEGGDGEDVFLIGVDSCAGETVAPPGWFQAEPSTTDGRGIFYRSATGERIPNMGEVVPTLSTVDDMTLSARFQLAKVNKPLMSVAKMTDQGHEVIFAKKNSRIITARGRTVPMVRVGNTFAFQVKEKKKGRKDRHEETVLAPVVEEEVFLRPAARS